MSDDSNDDSSDDPLSADDSASEQQLAAQQTFDQGRQRRAFMQGVEAQARAEGRRDAQRAFKASGDGAKDQPAFPPMVSG